MTRSNMMLFAFGMTFAPSFAFAANVSEADQEACTPDVFKLCEEFIPNEGPIVACLEAKRTQLSAACHQVMFPTAAKSVRPARRKAHHHKS